VLALFAIAGTAILTVFGITLPAFRIAGGLLLFHIAFEMIFETRHERHERSAERAVAADRIRDVGVFPLASPCLPARGAISATILFAGTDADPASRVLLLLIVAANLVAAWAVFLMAERIDGYLGATGRVVLTRLLGPILATLAVQFVIDGVTAVLAAR